jgi:fucose permease
LLRTPRAENLAVPAIAAFVMFGLPDGMIGVAWPAIRAGLGLPLDRLGVLLVANTAGYLLTSAANGLLVRRLSTGALVAAAAASALAGSMLILAGGALGGLVAGMLMLGAGGGVIDPSLSTLASLGGRHRLMNLLHGGYGVGAALGPGLVTAAIWLGSWRLAYLGLGVCQGCVMCWWAIAVRPPGATRIRAGGTGADWTGTDGTLAGVDRAGADWAGAARRSAVPLGLLAFFFVSGLEISAGAWAATYLRGYLGLSAAAAGMGVFGYWAALTASRLAAGALPHRQGPRQLALAGCLVAGAGAGILWWLPYPAAAITGLILVGCGTGPVFPALTSLTPQRVGRTWAAHLIGWQLGAGAAGAAILSSGIGIGLQRAGLQLTGPLLTGLAVVATGLAIALDRLAAEPAYLYQRPRDAGDCPS